MSKRTSSTLGALSLCALLAVTGAPAAYAKLGGSSKAASSSSMSRAAPSSNRIGGGQSVGMQRNDVMARERAAAPAPTRTLPPATTAAPAAQMPSPSAPAPSAKSGPGWGTVAGAAVAGAAIGGLATSAMANNNHPVQAGGQQVMPGVQGGAAAAGGTPFAVPAPSAQPHDSGFPFGIILLLLMGAGAAYYFYRKNAADTSAGSGGSTPARSYAAPSATPAVFANAADLDRAALHIFNTMQDANNRGDLTFLRDNTDREIFEEFAAAIKDRTSPETTSVVQIKHRVVDCTDEGERLVASIRYTGLIREAASTEAEPLNEVWHFTKAKGAAQWKLAGIEQV